MIAEPHGLTVARWGGAKALIFSVPCTDVEILALIDADGMKGVIYNPRLLAKPVPWLDRCPHCKRGQQRHVRLKIRKLVKILCSAKPDRTDGYRLTLPNRHRINARRTPDGWSLKIRKPGTKTAVQVMKLEGQEPTYFQGSARDTRSPLLLRTLRMLFSAREPDKAEVDAILLPVRNQDPKRLRPSQRTPCWKELARGTT